MGSERMETSKEQNPEVPLAEDLPLQQKTAKFENGISGSAQMDSLNNKFIANSPEHPR